MKYIKLLTLIALVAIATACSSDEEPAKALTGEEIAKRYNKLFLGKDSDNWLIPEEGKNNVFYVATENQESARTLCVHIIGDSNWSIDKKNYTLPDGCGNVSVQTSEIEGIFLTMALNIKGMDPLSLNIASVDYVLNNSNLVYFELVSLFKCKKCRATFRIQKGSKDKKCPICGSTDYNVINGLS